MIDYKRLLEKAAFAIEKASSFIMENLEKKNVDGKLKDAYELVTNLDIGSDKIIKDILSQGPEQFPIISEEDEIYKEDFKNGTAWILDPLDGTVNTLLGIPYSAVSIALVVNNIPVLGLTKNIFTGDLYYAVKGEGIYINYKKMLITPRNKIKRIISTGFPHNKELHKKHLKVINKIFEKVDDIRRFASPCLDLILLVQGRIHGTCEMLKVWDYAAGLVFLNEAGIITNIKSPFNNGAINEEQYFIAAHEELYADLLECIK